MRVLVAAIVLSSCLFFSGCDRAATSVPSSADGGATRREFHASPQALESLRRLSEFLGSRSAVRVKISMHAEGRNSGLPINVVEYALCRGAKRRVALSLVKGVPGCEIVCDGRDLYVLEVPFNRYMVRPAPESWSGLLAADVIGFVPHCELSVGVEYLFQDDLYSYLTTKYHVGRLLPDAEIDGTVCYRVEMEGDEFEWVVWFERGGKPSLRRVEAVSWHNEADPDRCLYVATDFYDWQYDIAIEDGVFEFKAPAEAKRVSPPPPASAPATRDSEKAEGGAD